jgi:hypothetical protein
MTDRYQVYTKVLKTLKQMIKLHHPGHVVTLAMMITGIVLSKKAQLSEMSNEVPVPAKDKSIEMRMRRWVKQEHLDEAWIYLPFAQQILHALAHLPLVVVMDASQVGRNCMVLMIGVVYKKRALPLVWLVYPGKKGHTSAERHIQVLEKLKALLPEGVEVILMGDAEYDTTAMLLWLQENTSWKYVLRTSPQIYVHSSQGEHPIADMPLHKKSVVQYRQVGFTQAASLQVNLVGWWGSSYEHPIYLLSNLEDKYQTCRYYRRRFRIETFFSDQKSRGFHIHKSHLSDPARVSRLLLAACLAYIWMILQGLQVIARNLTAWIDRTERQDKSLFRLGMDWLRHCLKRNWDFEPLFWFQPVPEVVNVR